MRLLKLITTLFEEVLIFNDWNQHVYERTDNWMRNEIVLQVFKWPAILMETNSLEDHRTIVSLFSCYTEKRQQNQ